MDVSQVEKCCEMNKIQFHDHVHFFKCHVIHRMTRTHICDKTKWLSSVMHVTLFRIVLFFLSTTSFWCGKLITMSCLSIPSFSQKALNS